MVTIPTCTRTCFPWPHVAVAGRCPRCRVRALPLVWPVGWAHPWVWAARPSCWKQSPCLHGPLRLVFLEWAGDMGPELALVLTNPHWAAASGSVVTKSQAGLLVEGTRRDMFLLVFCKGQRNTWGPQASSLTHAAGSGQMTSHHRPPLEQASQGHSLVPV